MIVAEHYVVIASSAWIGIIRDLVSHPAIRLGILGVIVIFGTAMLIFKIVQRRGAKNPETPGSGRPPAFSNPVPDATPAPGQQPTSSPSPPPGWYPDPGGAPGMQRYWDGTRWNSTAQPPHPGLG